MNLCSVFLYAFTEEAKKIDEINENSDVEKLRNELDRYKYIVLQQEEHIQVCNESIRKLYGTLFDGIDLCCKALTTS
jgi:hypothetical protein